MKILSIHRLRGPNVHLSRPAVVALPAGGYEVAFQANTGNLWTVGADPHNDW